MFFFNQIISGGPGLFFAAVLWIVVHQSCRINLRTPWPPNCYLSYKQRKSSAYKQYTVNAKGQLFDSPAGPGLYPTFYPQGLTPVIKSIRPDFHALFSGSVKKAGFLLGILLVFSFADIQAATISSTGTGGNWSAAATWVGGVVPGSGDDVSITEGSTVLIDTDVTVGSLSVSGILQFEAATARSVTVKNQVTVYSGGVFRSAQSGTIKNHRLIVEGSIINNGTIDFSSNLNATGAEIVFTGSGNAIFNCSDAPFTNLKQTNGITLDKGTSAASVLSFTPGNTFQVLSNGSSGAKGFLSVINGTFNIIGSNRFSNPVFNTDGNYTIPATGGFWLGNQNATVIGMNGTVTNLGDLKITNGTYCVGISGRNSLETMDEGQFKMSGGTLNVAGRFKMDGGIANISGGIINLATQANSADQLPALSMSGQTKLELYGTPLITIAYPNSKTVPSNDIQIGLGSGRKVVAGGNIQLGTEATPSGSSFFVDGDPVIARLTVLNECAIQVFNTSKSDLATTPVSALPKIAFDQIAPELTAPQKVTIQCGENLPKTYASLQEFTTAGGAASDNCTLVPASFKLVGQVQSSANCPYTITRTYEISDISGNVGTARHLISVEGVGTEPQPEAVVEPAKGEVLKLKSAMATFTAVQNGNWNDPATWGGASTPTSADDVNTASYTVTVDAAAFCNNITIGAGGTLNYTGTNTLTVNGNLTNTGTISSVGFSGKILLYGNWTNNGTYNGGTNGIVEFTGTNPATINGSTNFEELIINKGSLTNALTINGTATVLSSGGLTMTSGLVTIPSGGSFTVNPASALSIPAIAGFDVNGGTLTTGNFTITNEGLIRISSGTANFGNSSGNSVHTQTDGVFQVSGTSVVNIAGRLENTAGGTLAPLGIASGINISGGTVTLATQGNGLDNIGSLNVTTSGAFNFTGGTIVFQRESTAGPAIDMGLVSGSGDGSKTTVGGTFQFGNASTPVGTVFNISSSVPLNNVTSFPNADLMLINDVTIGNWALDLGTTIDLNGKKIQLAVSTSGTNYTFPIVNGTNSATLKLNFSGITTAGSVTIASSGTLPSGFLLDPGTLATPIFISNNTVVFNTVSGSYQLPAGFNASQKVGLYNGTWSYQPAAASVNFSGWNSINGSAFALADCTAPMITGTLNVCIGLATQLTGSDSPAASNPWISGTPSVATIDNSGLVTGVSAGTSMITYTNNAGCQQTVTVTVNALPTISGTLNVCIGLTTNLTGSGTPNATIPWSSSNTGVATVGNTGVVTGVSAGTSIITYKNSNGCIITSTVTVNPLPTITGTLNVCVGSTTQLTGSATAAASNPWVSASPSIATVNSTGLVTGVSAGTSVITYTNANGCTITATVTANPLPTISGTLNVCVGSTTPLTGSATPDATTPWASATTGVATVNTSGIVTGVSAGTSIITYKNSNGCIITATATVNPLPTISGTLNVCVGSTTQLTGSATAAVSNPWVSASPSIATVNSTGLVTGVSVGTSVITYTNTNGCTITATITVNPLPIPTITPVSATVCAGSTGNIYYTETGMSSYVWTVSAGGSITSGAGTNSITVTWSTFGAQLVTVSYTNANGCTAALPTIYNVTVNPKPTVVITNPLAVCSPSTVDLTASAVTSGSTAGLSYSYFTDAAGTITLNNPSTVSVTGTYYIKGTTAAGCSDIKAVTVTINPTPTVVITNPAAVCSPATVDLSAATVTAGSTASITYTYWTNAAATNPLANYSTVSITGTYYIKGATSSCYDIKPVSVIVNLTPIGTNTSTTICSGENPNVNLAATVSIPSSFTWVVGSVTGSVSNTTSGSGSTLSQTLTGSGAGGTVVYRVTPTSSADGCVGAAYSVTVTVNTLPTVTIQPEVEIVACERSFVSFTAAATGSPNPTVQWQISTGTGSPWTWTNLVDGGDINGVTTNALLVNIPNNAPSPRYYRAAYTNSCGTTYSSYSKLISDKGPLLNTDMPGTINGCAGGTITFTAKVTGAGAGNQADKKIDGIIQYLDGSTWVDIPSSAKSDNSGTLDYSFSIAISNYPYGTTFRIAFTGKCGSVSTSTRVIYPTSVVTAPNGCVGTPLTLSHDGSPGGTWTIRNATTNAIVYTLPNAPGQTLNYTPATEGCFTAQYATGSCNDTKSFVVFPALPNVAFVTSGCGSPVSLSALPVYTGFNAEYAVQPPSGVMSSWGTFAQAQSLLTNTGGCWTLKARYILAADCGTVLAGSTTTATGCTEAIFNAFVYPSKPVLTAPFNACASVFTLPSVPAISGFTVQWSIDNGAFTSTPTIPTTPGCHTLKARYVVSVACGTVAAGASGGVACESDPVSVVIFPLAPPTPTLSAGCGAFTVTPPATVSGFNIEYSFDDGATWSVSNTSTVGDNCPGYKVRTRYALAVACGATSAGTTGSTAACGSSPSVLRVVDTTPPAITCNTLAPAPVCPNTGSTYIHSGTSWDAVVTDNCAAPTALAFLSGTTTATNLTTLNNVAFNIGTTIVTWTASDGCNTSTCSFSVTVNPKPVITPMTATICSGGTFTVTPVNGANGIVPAGTTYLWAAPTVTGGLTGGVAGAGASITGALNNLTGSIQTATYTVTPTSGAGCAGSSFTVTVTVNPLLTCSITGTSGPVCPNSTGNIFSSVAGMTSYNWSITGNGAISVGGSTQTVTVTAGAACNAPFTLTLNYNDASGCSSSCTQIVNVVDNTAPVIAALPVLPSISCTTSPTFTTATATDACGSAFTLTYTDSTTAGACAGSYSITRTWSALDACGNSSTATQTINVQDTTPPVITCPGPYYQNANPYTCVAFPVSFGTATVTDSCGTYTVTNNAPAQFPVGVTTITWTATDACGNVATCSQYVTIYDVEPPVINCVPTTYTVNVDPGKCSAAVGLVTPTYTENCGAPITVSLWRGDGLPKSADFQIGTTTIVWTVTDASNNATTCTQTIVVVDNIQPVLACPPGYQVAAEPFQNYAANVGVSTPTYSDNCGNLWLTWTLKDNSGATVSTSTNPSGVSIVPSPYPKLFVGDNSITYTLTDAGGGVQSCTFIITVISRPDITCPASITTYTASNNCSATLDPGVPTLNQGAQPITWVWEMQQPDGSTLSGTSTGSPTSIGNFTFQHNTTTITWTASNISGSDSCTQTVTVIDNISPIYTPPPTPVEYCVESIISATYDPTDPVNNVIVNPDPDYFLFRTGVNSDTTLDLNIANLTDNCCPGTISWTITFSPVPDPNNGGSPITYPSVSGTGQPSAYSSNIQIWGDGVNYIDVVHKIDYTVTDCHGNLTSFKRDITINPRPKIVKMP